MITIFVNDQVVIASLDFPQKILYFPDAPPKFRLQTSFRPPNEKYNTIFNCLPQLSPNKWNICADIVQIIRELFFIAQDDAIIDEFNDKGSDSLHQQLVKFDISEIYSESQFNHMPSFGITRAATTPSR
jgi:ubiquitin-protein ligase